MLTAQSRIVLCLSAMLCSSVGVARAETTTSPITETASPTDALQQARERLERYDLDGTATFAELRALAVIASSDPEPARMLEARFLRAAAAADLIVIAAKLQRPALLDSLASALGCEPSALFATVKSELEAAAVAHYQAPAHNSLAMLAFVATKGTSAAPVVGVLRDFNAVEAGASAALSRDPSAALALLSDDPCEKRDGRKLAGTCALSTFDAASRRSLAALSNAASSNASLQLAAGKGDPLADALAPLAVQHASAFDDVVVCALPAFDDKPSAASASVALPTSLRIQDDSSTLALRITASEVRSRVTPCLSLRADTGEKPEHVELAWSKLALPATYRPYITPIAGLGEALVTQTQDATLGRVVVMADADVQAHVLARALVSLPANTNGASVSLLTRKSTGELRASPIEIARTESNTPSVHIRIRLGGYSLHVGNHFEDIPRVRTASGFSFDRATLEQRLASQPPSAIQISFMAEVTSDEVLAALSSTAERSQRVQLMIP